MLHILYLYKISFQKSKTLRLNQSTLFYRWDITSQLNCRNESEGLIQASLGKRFVWKRSIKPSTPVNPFCLFLKIWNKEKNYNGPAKQNFPIDAPKQKPAGQLAFNWEKHRQKLQSVCISYGCSYDHMDHVEMIQTELFSKLALWNTLLQGRQQCLNWFWWKLIF